MSYEFVAKEYVFVHNGTAFQSVGTNETEKAIAILSRNPKGFFLMVEGGRIDHASHARSLDNTTMDTLAFDDAVRTALDFAKKGNDTLVIVTADHECGGLVLQPENLGDYEAGGLSFWNY